MTLTDFLLARIAEDEAGARGELEMQSRHGVLAREWRLLMERALARCEADRALILELARMERDEMGWDGVESKVMAYLASAYADHPDYREEWRP